MSKRKKLKNPRNWLVVAVNVLLSVFMFIALVTYYKAYQKDLYSHHGEDIKNINRSAASLFGTIYEGRRVRLGNVERYAGAFNATEEELLNYVASLNSDKNVVHELIRGDYSGLAGFRGGDSDGEFSPLNYAGAEYDSLHPIFDSASYGGEEFGITAEFLDGQSGKRSLAVYIYISLLNAEGAQDNYTLLSVSSTEYYQKAIRTSHQYTELETALVDSHGNCVIGGEKFSFDNFFDYLNANESVPASEEEKLSAFFTALGEEAALELNNPMGERCVYVCEPVDGTDWYAVSCVPINSFPSETADMSFAILIGAFFVVLMCFNICYLSSLNKKLRKSVESETVANRAKTDFLSRMSHDMRTPMNGIIGMAGFIDEATTLSEAKGYNKSVLESCKYLLMLINDTLDLNRIESGKLKPLFEVTRKKDLKNSICEEIL
ncbi:MAG: hypothetical protein GX683_04180, partial [Ruminococcaceae bacterium]|nr:hypothetical protein [Oscillospiraceae bacterium]